MKCSVEECNKEVKCKGLCQKHYTRYYRHGSPTTVKKIFNGLYSAHEREYNSWHSMKQRCLNKNNPNYKWYGRKGISICDEWLDGARGFANFYNDMGERPEGTSLDRIDVNGDYCPENCRWATPGVQSANQHNRRKYSGTLGVSYDKAKNKWCAYLRKNGSLYRKYCRTEEEAVSYRKHLEESL